MNKNANYRKLNDRSLNSSTYHKKDGTAIRAKLKKELEKNKKDLRETWEDKELRANAFLGFGPSF
jgi:hypothetical protein